jgi:hypothetical protein
MPTFNDKDLTEHFVASQAADIAETTKKLYPGVSEKIILSVNNRQEVNNRALALLEEKGEELCSSLFALCAERDPRIAAAVQMGWYVGDFLGIGMFCNHIAKHALEEEGDFDKAVIYRTFCIATLRVGVAHVESETIADIISMIYDAEVTSITEDDWDTAHANLAIEQAENEVMWEDSQNL